MAGFRSLARNRDFTTLWVGETVSELGSTMSLFVLPLVGLALTGSPVAAGLAGSAHLLGTVLALAPAGVLVDRVDRRRLLVGASAAGVLLYSTLAFAGATGHLTTAHLVGVGFAAGAAAGLAEPARISAIRSVVSTAELPTALSQNEARQHVAGLLGGPLGGVLLVVAQWLPFAVNALTSAVSCLALGLLRADLSAPVREGPRPGPGQDLAGGLRFVLGRPLFRVLLVWSALVNLTVNALLFVVVLRLAREGFHPGQIGLASTAAGVGGVLGALVAPTLIRRFATGRLTVLVGWSVVLPLVPLVWWVHPVVAAAALFVVLLLNPAGNAGITAYRIAVTPAALQGRVQATSSFLARALMPLAPLVGGLLLETYGGATATALLLVATAGTALVITLSRAVRTVPRPDAWPAGGEVTPTGAAPSPPR